MLKICTKCGVAKPSDAAHFSKDPKQSSGLRPNCKDCSSAAAKARYVRNKGRIDAKAAEYRAANLEKVRARDRAAHQRKLETDPEGYKAKRRAYHQRAGKYKFRAWFKKRMKEDPKFRVSVNLGARFRQFVKNKPQGGFQAIVGYTHAELHAHIEAQFDATMSWDNYGSVWEIDHKRPVSSFDLPDEAALCWALTNLRPLACSANRKKSNTIIPELIGFI